MFLVYLKGMRGPEPQLVSSLDVLTDINGKMSDRYLEHYDVPTPVGVDRYAINYMVSKYPCKTTWPPPYEDPPVVLNPDPGPTPTSPAAEVKAADEDYTNEFVNRYYGDRAAVR